MSDLTIRHANTALATSCAAAARRFFRAVRQPERAQPQRLLSILRRNADCLYGRAHRLHKACSVQDFQAALPLVTYDDLRPWIERARGGERSVLTSEEVLLIERTGGSTSAAKHIPYTSGLLREFQAALAPWLWNLYATYPSLRRCTAYWQVTPLGRTPEQTRGGIPVGLGSEPAYFTIAQQRALARTLCVPSKVANIPDLESALHATLFLLLRDEHLGLISVWNPTLFSILLKRAHDWRKELVRDLHDGELRSSHLPANFQRAYPPAPQRALRVDQCLRAKSPHPQELWPKLSVVSCWGDAGAAHEFQLLERRFPCLTFQKKGLLATEGVVTIPVACACNVAAVTSHFLEFLDSAGKPRLVHQLEPDGEYSVVLTTSGGLWRYRLGDRVRVSGFFHRTPILDFLGREDGVSDLRGEKLSPVFVAEVLDSLRGRGLLPLGFAMLAPTRRLTAGYVLFIEGAPPTELAAALDAGLRANPQYAYARKLGQLAAPRLVTCGPEVRRRYIERCTSLGQRAGSVKPAALHPADGWESWLCPS